jgi:D-alanine-D-alanine ligase
LNKDLAKQCITAAGLKTPKFQVISRDRQFTPDEVKLEYPLFVKPTNRGGGAGVDTGSLVYTFQQLQAKVRSLSDSLQSDSLAEEYLPGREFSVGILREAHTDRYAAMPIELIAPQDETGARYLSSRVKAMDTEYHVQVSDRELRAEINALAIGAFRALGARDYGRIDIRLDAMGTPHFLEANLLPSLLNDYGNFPKACLLNINLKHEPMILRIVDLAFWRGSAVMVGARDVGSMQGAVTLLASPEPV